MYKSCSALLAATSAKQSKTNVAVEASLVLEAKFMWLLGFINTKLKYQTWQYRPLVLMGTAKTLMH